MKAIRRHALTVATLALGAAGAPSVLTAQRTVAPDRDTPRILVATFGSPDRKLGAQVGDAVRDRIQSEVNPKQLWVISKNDINTTLTASGYQPDSALGPSDLKELAKLLRADEILGGAVSRTATGVRIEPVMMLARDVSLAQPLPAVEGKDAGAAAKQLERDLGAARKQLSDNKKCENALRAQKYDEAIAAAQAGIRAYPQATLARLCLMSAFSYMKAPSDSVLRVAEEVIKIDPKSKLALGNAVEAYQTKGDTAKAIQASINLYRADPTNTALIQDIINRVASMGKPDVALPLIDDIMKDNPGDPQILRTRWLLLLAARRFKDALAAGEEYTKADTAAANVDFFNRMIGAAAADSQPQVASQIAARAVQRFPKDANLQLAYAQTLRKAGQLQQAVSAYERAVAIDPKLEGGNAYLLLVVTQNELKQPDSALASARKAVAAGVNRDVVGPALLQLVAPAVKEAQTAKTREAWVKAYRAAAMVDSIAPSPNTKFYIGVSTFQAGLDALSGINASKTKCEDARFAEDMWAQAQIAMPQGASVDKNVAGQILGAIQQYSDNIAKAKAATCKAGKH